jgi:hypothetical protein
MARSSDLAGGREPIAIAEVDRPEHGVRAASASKANMKGETHSPAAEPTPPRPTAAASGKSSGKAHASQQGPVAVPVRVVSSESSPVESDIRRLTRIIFSDIVIYGPEKADKAIRQGRFAESYKTEIEEGRKIIRSRFPSDTAGALQTFQRCLEELLEARKKELQAAVAL